MGPGTKKDCRSAEKMRDTCSSGIPSVACPIMAASTGVSAPNPIAPTCKVPHRLATNWGLSSNGTEMYAKGVDRYLPEMRLRRIQE